MSAADIENHLERLKQLRCVNYRWPLLNSIWTRAASCVKDAVLAILAVIAKQERVRLSERDTMAEFGSGSEAEGRVG